MTGDVVHNLVTGERIRFTRSRAPALEFDLELRPLGVPGGLAHRHLPAERIEVESGALIAFVAGRLPRRAGAGDVVEIPPRRWHLLVAVLPTRAHVTVEPAMRFGELIACMASVSRGDLRPATLRRVNELLAEHDCAPRLPS
jgi:hypothetical protein